MNQRSNIVKLRLTDLEKADWQEAAGGTRLLSDWIRRCCNAEAERARNPLRTVEATDFFGGPDFEQKGVADIAVPVPNAKPKIVAAAIGRETAPPGQCPRWFHHRPGAYCGACKKVIAK